MQYDLQHASVLEIRKEHRIRQYDRLMAFNGERPSKGHGGVDRVWVRAP